MQNVVLLLLFERELSAVFTTSKLFFKYIAIDQFLNIVVSDR